MSSTLTPNHKIKALVDSGSTHCFIETKFVRKYNIRTRSVDPIPLRLFDGSTNSVITEAIELPITFPDGHTHSVDCYVTPLDLSVSIVLGHNWLTRHNPLIDWVLGSITFRTILPDVPVETLPDTARACRAEVVPNLSLEAPRVALRDAAAFSRACKLEGSRCFQLNLAEPEPETSARSASAKPEPVDLKDVPKEYHDFADVFSKSKADSLAPHRPYDLKIALEDGATPPQPPLYSLSTLELATLREFIDEHLNMGYIRPTRSSHGAPILFIKKKSGELRLCVDFRALNKIMKKDRYPLLLITNLLDAPRKARIYTKIDLHHAFHLVRVAEGNEWKTAFRT